MGGGRRSGETAKLGGDLSTQIAELANDDAKQTRVIVSWTATFGVAVCTGLVAVCVALVAG